MSDHLYKLEDLELGKRIPTAGRTITEADIVSFTGISGDFAPMHIDEEWSRENHPFGSRVAQGMLIASVTYALRAPIIDNLDVIGWMEELRRFRAPVRAGDTVRATWSIDEVRPSKSRPGTGIAKLGIEIFNQRKELVQDGYDVLMVSTREPARVDE